MQLKILSEKKLQDTAVLLFIINVNYYSRYVFQWVISDVQFLQVALILTLSLMNRCLKLDVIVIVWSSSAIGRCHLLALYRCIVHHQFILYVIIKLVHSVDSVIHWTTVRNKCHLIYCQLSLMMLNFTVVAALVKKCAFKLWLICDYNTG